MTQRELSRLIELARAGDLPSDPSVLASTVEPRENTTCSLCTQSLGHERAFELRTGDRIVLLHRQCFSAWLEVVVVPRCEPRPPH